MSVVSQFFTYAKLVVVLVGRMVINLLQTGISRFSEMTRSLLRSHVDLANGEKELLGTESVEDTKRKDLADEWVAVSDEDNWEPGGRDLLDNNGKRSHQDSESITEDELIELSDGEDRATLITSLHSAKRSPLRASTKLTLKTPERCLYERNPRSNDAKL